MLLLVIRIWRMWELQGAIGQWKSSKPLALQMKHERPERLWDISKVFFLLRQQLGFAFACAFFFFFYSSFIDEPNIFWVLGHIRSTENTMMSTKRFPALDAHDSAVCWSQLLLARKGQLLNSQEFYEPIVRHTHY